MRSFAAITVRDARSDDVRELTRIKGPDALHVDRLVSTEGEGFRYLVAQQGEVTIGFACLVFERPFNWSDANDTSRLPQIVDMMIATDQRGKGYGSAFISALENLCAELGFAHIYLSVDPVENAAAHELYSGLGYRALQADPYRAHWQFTDSEGNRHRGSHWTLDMVKRIGSPA